VRQRTGFPAQCLIDAALVANRITVVANCTTAMNTYRQDGTMKPGGQQ